MASPEPKSDFAAIPKLTAIDNVLRRRGFGQTDALVLIGLIIRSDSNYTNAFPSSETLAIYAKLKRTDPVFQSLNRLEKRHGYILRRKRRGTSNVYSINIMKLVEKSGTRSEEIPLSAGHPVNTSKSTSELPGDRYLRNRGNNRSFNRKSIPQASRDSSELFELISGLELQDHFKASVENIVWPLLRRLRLHCPDPELAVKDLTEWLATKNLHTNEAQEVVRSILSERSEAVKPSDIRENVEKILSRRGQFLDEISITSDQTPEQVQAWKTYSKSREKICQKSRTLYYLLDKFGSAVVPSEWPPTQTEKNAALGGSFPR